MCCACARVCCGWAWVGAGRRHAWHVLAALDQLAVMRRVCLQIDRTCPMETGKQEDFFP